MIAGQGFRTASAHKALQPAQPHKGAETYSRLEWVIQSDTEFLLVDSLL